MRTSRYDVIDVQTQKVVGSFKNSHRAHRFADRKDMEYGAVRYVVKPIWEA